MELHSQHAAGGLRDRCRTDDSVISERSVTSRRRGRRSDLSGRHIVSVNLNSVDVGDHSELVLELQIDSSHDSHAHEGLAEVLGSRGGLRGGSESNNGPGTVGEANVLPVSRGRSSVLPVSVVTDGGIEGEAVVLLGFGSHHSFVNDVAVDTNEFDVSTTGPRIASTVLHLQRVQTVRVGGEAGFHGTRRRISKSGGCIKDGRATQNLERLLTGPGTRLLGDLDVVLTITAGKGHDK